MADDYDIGDLIVMFNELVRLKQILETLNKEVPFYSTIYGEILIRKAQSCLEKAYVARHSARSGIKHWDCQLYFDLIFSRIFSDIANLVGKLESLLAHDLHTAQGKREVAVERLTTHDDIAYVLDNVNEKIQEVIGKMGVEPVKESEPSGLTQSKLRRIIS